MNLLKMNLRLVALAILAVCAALGDVTLFVTSRENNQILNVDVTTNVITLVTTPPAGCTPDSLQLDSQNRILYDCNISNQLRRFDPAGPTDVLLADSTNGINSPQDILLEPGGGSVLVSNFLGNSITRTNLTTLATTPLVIGIANPQGLAYDNVGRLFAITGFSSVGTTSFVVQIDPVTGAILHTSLAFDPTNTLDSLIFDPFSKLLYASSQGGNAIYSIDPTTLVAIKVGTIPKPDGLTTDGTGLLYAASRGDFAVHSFNVLTNVATKLTAVPGIDDIALIVNVPPSITKTFGTATINPGASTTMTLVITSPLANPSTNVGFIDALPAGLAVAAVPNLVNGCGGTVTGATAGSTTVSLTGATLAAGASCTITLSVTDSNPPGTTSQNCVTVTSANGNGNQSCAQLLVSIVVPLLSPSVMKSFGAPLLLLNATTSMTITIGNPNTTAASNINFVDTLPSGLVVATPNGLTSTCGGTATATAGSQTVSLTGGSLPAGGSCTVTLNVTGIAVGLQVNNVTVNMTVAQSVISNSPPATASLVVIGPPVIEKSFSDATIALGGTTALSFKITNPNASVALLGVAFTDTLPAGLVIATPNGLIGSCGGGTITAFAGTNAISLTGATLAAAGSCSFSVNVTAVVAGTQINVTSNVTSTNGGPGNIATATIDVAGPDDAFQVQYIPHVNIGNGAIDLTNAGSLGADAFGPLSGTTGRICVNVYTFSPDEQEISCCSCLVTPNALDHLTAADLVSNTLTGVKPDSIVVKLLATVPGVDASTPGTQAGPFTNSVCNAASPFNFTNLAPGMRAWATKLHALPTSPVTYGITEGRFKPAILSPGELAKLTNLCQFIVGNGSGAGQCKACTLGGLGAEKK
jgi:hypothetical protein